MEIKSDWEFLIKYPMGNQVLVEVKNASLVEASRMVSNAHPGAKVLSKTRAQPVIRDEPDYYPRS